MQTNQIIAAVVCFLETFQKFLPGNIILNPENEAFVGNGSIDFRTVDRMAVYEQDVPWSEVVGFSFDMISSFSGDKNDYFMKIVIVISKFFFCLVFNMKKSELLIKVIRSTSWIPRASAFALSAYGS